MSQPQHTYKLRKEVGFGAELAMSQLGEPHEIQIEDSAGAYDLVVRVTTDALASLRASSLWTTLSVTPGILTPVPVGIRKLAVEITAINDVDAAAPTVFHLPGFFRGAESARYYGVDQLDRPSTTLIPGVPDPQLWFDPTDASTVWADAAGTIPATDGVDVLRIDNKGTDPNLLFLNEINSEAPVYRTSSFAGLNMLDGSTGGSLTSGIRGRAVGARPGLNGMSWFGVTVKDALPPADEHGLIWDSSPGNVPRLHWSSSGGDRWRTIGKGGGAPNQVLGPITLSEWVWAYGVYETNRWLGQVSGGVQQAQIGSGTYVQNNDNEYFMIHTVGGRRGESIVWDVALTDQQILNYIAYLDGKYGMLPI